MGIRDRDYMKRSSDNGGGSVSPADNKLEEFLSGFLARHPRFFLYLGIGLGVMILAGLFVARFSAHSH